MISSPAASATARRVTTYGEVGFGEYGLVTDAWGWITVIRFEASAADGLLVGRDDLVWISRPDA